MINFKLVQSHRTLAKHVVFESSFAGYSFKGSADLAKYPENPKYAPIAARLNIFEQDDKGFPVFRGKLRVKRFDEKGNPVDSSLEATGKVKFTEEQLRDILKAAMNQLKLV